MGSWTYVSGEADCEHPGGGGRERGHAVFACMLAERFSRPIVLQRDRARELHHAFRRLIPPVEEVEGTVGWTTYFYRASIP